MFVHTSNKSIIVMTAGLKNWSKFWDFIANMHGCCLLFVVVQSGEKWRHKTETCQINANGFLTTEIPLMTGVANIVGRCRGVLWLLSCTRALQSVQHVSRGLHWRPHTSAFWMDGRGQAALLSAQDYFTSLHYSTNETHANNFHVFQFPGVSSVSLYLCTQMLHSTPGIKLTKLQHYSPNVNSGWQV